MDVAAYNQRVTGPDHVVNVVDEAIKTALSYRTVAHITIPKDVQDWNSESKRSAANVPAHSADLFAAAIPVPSQELLTQAAAVINEGSKVAILAGRGCLNAAAEIL